QDRGVHRPDATLRHPGARAHRTDRAGPRYSEPRRRTMKPPAPTLPSATRPVAPALASLLQGLRPGQRVRITQTVRVGSSGKWPPVVEGTFRDVRFLATGLATERVREDDIVVVTVHFTKANGELSSVSLDENSKIEVLGG